MTSPQSNAASNLLADLSAMLAGPKSADGTLRRGDPGLNDPVFAMKPTTASPSPSPVTASTSNNGMAVQTPVAQSPSVLTEETKQSFVVAHAMKALTHEFVKNVGAMSEAIGKLEGRMARIEGSLEQHTLSVNALSASVDKNFVNLAGEVRDVMRSVQLLKDKQELFEAQQEIARATVTTKGMEARDDSKEESAEEGAEEEDDESSEEEPEPVVVVKKKAGRRRSSLKDKGRDKGKEVPDHQPEAQAPAMNGHGAPPAMAPPVPGVFQPGAGFPPPPVPAASFQPRPNQFSPGQAPGQPTSMPMPPRQQQVSPQMHQYSQGPPAPSPQPQPQPQYPGGAGQGHTHAGLPAPVLPPPPPYGGGQYRQPPPPHMRPPPPGPPQGQPAQGQPSQVSSSRIPIERVVEDVAAMGFTRQAVREVVRKLTENGQSVDLNIVLDQLMRQGGGPTHPPPPPPQQQWYGH